MGGITPLTRTLGLCKSFNKLATNKGMESNHYIIIGFAISCIVAIVFIALFIQCKSKEPYCGRCADSKNMCGSCVGMGSKTCPNRAEVSKLYNEGKLTEYSGWGNEPRHWNSPLDDRIDYEKDDCKPKWPTSTYV
jgi:hypothetical protein